MRSFIVAYLSFHENEIKQEFIQAIDNKEAEVFMLRKQGWEIDNVEDYNIDELADVVINSYEVS